MPGHDDRCADSESIARTRRQVLASLGVAGLIGVAGCGGDGGQEDDETPTQSPGANPGGGAGGGSPTPSGDGGNGGSCPDGFTYVAQEFSALGYEGAIGSCDVPESARIQLGALGSMDSGLTVIAEFQDGSFRSLGITTDFTEETRRTSPTVEGVLSFIREQADQQDWVDVTGRFDLSVSGTVIASSEDDLPEEAWLVYDHPEGVLGVNVSNGGQGCPTASVEFYERLISSQRPA